MAYSNVTTPVHFHVNVNKQKFTVGNNSVDNDAKKSLDHKPEVAEIIGDEVVQTPVL